MTLLISERVCVEALYIGATALAITMVVLGEAPKETLFGLPVGLLLIWFFSYSAAKVKLPPK
jgi:hypothetical protein